MYPNRYRTLNTGGETMSTISTPTIEISDASPCQPLTLSPCHAPPGPSPPTHDSELSTQDAQNAWPSPPPPSPDKHPFLTPGTLTLILGDPGAGKSLLALDLAA